MFSLSPTESASASAASGVSVYETVCPDGEGVEDGCAVGDGDGECVAGAGEGVDNAATTGAVVAPPPEQAAIEPASKARLATLLESRRKRDIA